MEKNYINYRDLLIKYIISDGDILSDNFSIVEREELINLKNVANKIKERLSII